MTVQLLGAHPWVPNDAWVLVVPVTRPAHIGLHYTDARLRCCSTLHKAAATRNNSSQKAVTSAATHLVSCVRTASTSTPVVVQCAVQHDSSTNTYIAASD